MNEEGFRIEDEFREMFAERSAQVAQSPAPYGRLRQRIITARRRRRQRVGGAAAALLVVAVGAGAWSAVGGSQGTKAVRPAGPTSKPGAVRYAYDDGSKFGDDLSGYVGYMKAAADAYLTEHAVKVPAAGGSTIVTTFNHKMMDDAVAAADDGLWKQAESSHLGSDVHLAFASIDPATGQVKAFYTGVDGVEDYSRQAFNAALHGGVQIGNLVFPVTMAAALENGFSPDSLEPATNTRQLYWPIGATGSSNRLQYRDMHGVPQIWPPTSDDAAPGSAGVITLREAMALSLNAPFADLEMESSLTPLKVYNMARALGIKPETPDFNVNPALALGVATVSPLRMANAYAAFPAGGVHHEPVMVSKVLDADGKVVWQPKADAEQAMTSKTAGQMRETLTNVLAAGTASGNPVAAALHKEMPDTAGKTSTTDFAHSAWFDGFNGKLSTAVAMYRQQPDGTLESLAMAGGGRVNGLSFPTTVWAKFMTLAGR